MHTTATTPRFTKRQLAAHKRRLDTARQVLQAAEVFGLRKRVDEAEACLAATVSPAKLTADDGSVEAWVILGSWMHDAETGETGPGLICRIGSAAPIQLLLDCQGGETMGPDIAPGDRIRIKKISSRLYAYIEQIQPAQDRRPCNWTAAWRSATVPSLRAVGVHA